MEAHEVAARLHEFPSVSALSDSLVAFSSLHLLSTECRYTCQRPASGRLHGVCDVFVIKALEAFEGPEFQRDEQQ